MLRWPARCGPGAISFGLLTVPVGVFRATEEHEPSFHQFAEGTVDRIRYKRVNERSGDEVADGDVVKGVVWAAANV